VISDRIKKHKVCIIGLGYVGLPLAVLTSKKYKVVGFDRDALKIEKLKNGVDDSNEISKKDISSSNILFTNKEKDLKNSDFYIVTVPTPVKKNNEPDLRYLKNASKLIGRVISKNDIVIFESTVYPGVTEDICVPIIEKQCNLKLNKGFFAGYSPERVNPGLQGKNISDIVKVVSGSDNKTAKKVNSFYESIISAGTYLAPSIKVAEASKVIENIQRDLNIALMNEISIIFDSLDINTSEVIATASTKWNFLKFSPGIVGGHCIGIDPYYLTFESMRHGHIPDLILTARNLNEKMSKHIYDRTLKGVKKKEIKNKSLKVLLLGYTFKEDCRDTRNTKVLDIAKLFTKNHHKVHIYDPLISEQNINIPNLKFLSSPKLNFYDVILFCVPHTELKKIGLKKLKSYGKKKHYFFDIKSVFKKFEVDDQL